MGSDVVDVVVKCLEGTLLLACIWDQREDDYRGSRGEGAHYAGQFAR